MKLPRGSTSWLAAVVCGAAPALAQQLVSPEPLGEPATTVYRQRMPDGGLLYSDKAQRGAKIDQTLQVEPPPEGSVWSVEGGARPSIPEQVERTPVKQVNAIPASGTRRTVEDAQSDVIRAEMLLEDALRARDAGMSPLPGEAGGTGPGSTYAARQAHLAHRVAQAQNTLQQALAERDALRENR